MSTEADHLGDLTEIPDGSQTASDDAAAVPVSQDTATAVTAEDGAGHSDENNEGHEDGAAAALPTPNATHSGLGQTAADTPLPSTPPKEGSSLLDTTTDLAAQLATPSASGPGFKTCTVCSGSGGGCSAWWSPLWSWFSGRPIQSQPEVSGTIRQQTGPNDEFGLVGYTSCAVPHSRPRPRPVPHSRPATLPTRTT